MDKKLRALFEMDVARMKAVVDRMNATSNATADVSVSGDEGISVVTGKSQDVMLVIGAVADNGEDCLAKVGNTALNAALIAEKGRMLAILKKLTSFYTCKDEHLPRGYECSARPYYGLSDKDIIAAWEDARAVVAKATNGN